MQKVTLAIQKLNQSNVRSARIRILAFTCSREAFIVLMGADYIFEDDFEVNLNPRMPSRNVGREGWIQYV